MSTPGFYRLLKRIAPVDDREIPALLWGFAQILFLIAGNYVFRPIRDSLGSTRGSIDLKYLYLGTFAATLITAASWSALVARFPVKRFMAIAYQFFAGSFIVFWALLTFVHDAGLELEIGYAFFIWYSVYNIFIVSVFWSRAADLFTFDQGRRLFAFMAAGASLGAIAGSWITKTLVKEIGTVNLLVIPVVFLQAAMFCARRLAAAAARARSAEAAAVPEPVPPSSAPVRGTVWGGLGRVVASPLLVMIALYVLSASLCGTCIYNMQNDLAREAFPGRDARTDYFATVDFSVNVIAFLCEAFLTARIISWIGVGAALLFLPAVYSLGFSVASIHPVLATIAVLAIVQRSVAYGITTPARESLFTVVSRDEKYKAKNAIDTFIWRGGDAAAVWLVQLLLVVTNREAATPSAKATVIAAFGVPIAFLWMLAAWRLRRLHREAVTAAR